MQSTEQSEFVNTQKRLVMIRKVVLVATIRKKEIINGVETWTGWTTNEFESLDIKDIEKLAKAKGIADYNITTATTPVNPVKFPKN